MAKITEIIDALQIYFNDDSGAFLASEWHDFKNLWQQLQEQILFLRQQPTPTSKEAIEKLLEDILSTSLHTKNGKDCSSWCGCEICVVRKPVLEALSLLRQPKCETCGGSKYVTKLGRTTIKGVDMPSCYKETCPDCPPAKPEGEFTKDSSYFSKTARTAFREREKELRACKRWPNTKWYNDEDFCEIYNEACDRFDQLEQQGDNYGDLLGSANSDVRRLSKYADGLEAEQKECRQILEKQLDRDKDPQDTLRDLVVVACNALYWVRAKKKHFVMAKLQAQNTQQAEEIGELKKEIEVHHTIFNLCPHCKEQALKEKKDG